MPQYQPTAIARTLYNAIYTLRHAPLRMAVSA